jgi:hypothetical protein
MLTFSEFQGDANVILKQIGGKKSEFRPISQEYCHLIYLAEKQRSHG